MTEMKQATRKYANYQVKWIRKRLLPAIESAKGGSNLVAYDTIDTSGQIGGVWMSLRYAYQHLHRC